MKKSTNKKGFTLVELIVVIAIIGVLAAILVPSMMGYVKSSKISSANSSAKSVYTAANNVCQKCDNAGEPLAAGIYGNAFGATVKDVDVSNCVSDTDGQTFTNFIAKELGQKVSNGTSDDENITVQFAVGISDGGPTCAVYASTAKDLKYTGGYPTAAKDISSKGGKGIKGIKSESDGTYSVEMSE